MKKLLLDTHVFLWLIADSKRLSVRWREEFEDPSNELFLSAVSVWEISLKYRIGKLALPAPPAEYIAVRRERHRITALPLHEASAAYLPSLPRVERDPFDAMLACQAIYHQLTLVSVDSVFLAYPVKLLPF